jgi:signal transduction histidine kinase
MARILIVDDDVVIIKLYEAILKKQGFDLDIAYNGAEMMQRVREHKPDVIVLDVILPDDSGLDLCAAIKRDPQYLGVKVLLVSGMEISPAQVAEGIETGADDYLTKPFDSKVLLARIKNCLKLKSVEEELREKYKELKDLANHIQTVREEERKFMAREVQEELGQLTAAIKMDVDWLALNIPGIEERQQKRLAHASSTATTMIQMIRRIASALRPSMLDELGLNASLEWLCREFITTNQGIPCKFIPAENDEGLSSELKTAFFRICQEALRNVAQHANASLATVTAVVNDKQVSLQVKDNGQGFDIHQRKNTMDLIGMRERALAINGQLQIHSAPGQGTLVSVVVMKA